MSETFCWRWFNFYDCGDKVQIVDSRHPQVGLVIPYDALMAFVDHRRIHHSADPRPATLADIVAREPEEA